jgi:hypothetical protein
MAKTKLRQKLDGQKWTFSFKILGRITKRRGEEHLGGRSRSYEECSAATSPPRARPWGTKDRDCATAVKRCKTPGEARSL